MPIPTQEQVIEFCHENSILDFLGVEIVPTDDGCARLELKVKPHHSNPYGILHGGVLTTMADTAMGAISTSGAATTSPRLCAIYIMV